MPHRCRDGAVVPRRDEGQPPQNGGDGHNVYDWPRLGLVQLLGSTLAGLPPPGGGVPAADRGGRFAAARASSAVGSDSYEADHALHLAEEAQSDQTSGGDSHAGNGQF